MIMPATPVPEFSRRVLVDALPAQGRAFDVSADSREREALAKRFGIPAIARLELAGTVNRVRGGTVVQLSARLVADVTQACVITLEPVHQHIDTEFVRLYAEDARTVADLEHEIYFDASDEEIDPVQSGRIDVGETAAEQLALELDPYPRAAGAQQATTRADRQQPASTGHPFAELGVLSPHRRSRNKSK